MAAGVLDAEEVATATSLIWDHVEARSAAAYPDRPVSRGDPASWGGKGLWGSGGEGDGYGLLVDQHCAGMWYVRGLPRVHEMWTALHGGESSLAVSFDGAQLWRPWDVNPEWHAQDVTGFLHCDRRPFPAPSSSVWCRVLRCRKLMIVFSATPPAKDVGCGRLPRLFLLTSPKCRRGPGRCKHFGCLFL